MNSSVNSSSESTHFLAADQTQDNEQAKMTAETSPSVPTATASDEAFSDRHQPIPPPSEPMQYRAIGLVRGRYSASAEQFTQGTLIATDGAKLNAVLLGRIMSLVKNHLDLEQEHLWVVYPRIGQQDGNLHLQIVGVWEPENLSKHLNSSTQTTEEETEEKPTESASTEAVADKPAIPTSHEIEDGYFSVRGEVVYQSASNGHFVVKIKQAPRKESEKPKYFKLKLKGILATKAIGQFWDLQAKREAESLVLQQGESIAVLPSKPKLKKDRRLGGQPGPKRYTETPRPIRKGGESTSVARTTTNRPPTPKPIKRQNPPQK